jgi:hypothetical protein
MVSSEEGRASRSKLSLEPTCDHGGLSCPYTVHANHLALNSRSIFGNIMGLGILIWVYAHYYASCRQTIRLTWLLLLHHQKSCDKRLLLPLKGIRPSSSLLAHNITCIAFAEERVIPLRRSCTLGEVITCHIRRSLVIQIHYEILTVRKGTVVPCQDIADSK